MELVFHRDGKNGNGTSPPQSASGVEDFGYGLRGDPASRKALSAARGRSCPGSEARARFTATSPVTIPAVLSMGLSSLMRPDSALASHEGQ